ncbi:unnamed protein product [Amoebophrya sp. A120]|nr:unnamed protein product [Amoebophrya sp. A120]|eukprot:GSA120T00012215001.1
MVGGTGAGGGSKKPLNNKQHQRHTTTTAFKPGDKSPSSPQGSSTASGVLSPSHLNKAKHRPSAMPSSSTSSTKLPLNSSTAASATSATTPNKAATSSSSTMPPSPSKNRLRAVAATSQATYIGGGASSDEDETTANSKRMPVKLKRLLLGALVFASVFGQIWFAYYLKRRYRAAAMVAAAAKNGAAATTSDGTKAILPEEEDDTSLLARPPPGYTDGYAFIYDLAKWSLFYTVVQVLFSYVVRPLFFAIIQKQRHWSEESYEMRVSRATSACFKFFYHLACVTYWVYLLTKESWSTDWPMIACFRQSDPRCFVTDVARGMWRSNGKTGRNELEERFWANFWKEPAMVGDEVKWFYVAATGYLISEMILIFPERARSDFLEMCLHHTIAIGLSLFSYGCGFIRIGSLVMFVHTLSDVSIYLSRTTVDVRSTGVVAVCFVALCLSFFWLRLCVFPLVLVRSAFLDGPRYLVNPVDSELIRPFCLMLSVLVMLHWYWWCMIVRSGWNFARTGQARDLASQLSVFNLKRLSSAQLHGSSTRKGSYPFAGSGGAGGGASSPGSLAGRKVKSN